MNALGRTPWTRQPQFAVGVAPDSGFRPETSLVLLPGFNLPVHQTSQHGLEFHTSVASYYTANAPRGTRTQMTILFAGRQTAAPGDANFRYFEIGGNNVGGGFGLEQSAFSELVIGWTDSFDILGDTNWVDFDVNVIHGYAAVLNGSLCTLFRDGAQIASLAISWNAANTGSFAIGGATETLGVTSRALNFGVSLFAVDFNNAIPLRTAAELSRKPWQIFAPLPRQLWALAGAAPPPTLTGTLGQWDPELRLAAWW